MRKEDTYTLLGTLFSDTLAWVSGKRKSPKVLNLRTFLIFSVFIRRCGREKNRPLYPFYFQCLRRKSLPV